MGKKKWVHPELTANKKKKKIVGLKCCLLLFYIAMNHFWIRLWYVPKSGFYTNPAIIGSMVGLRRSSKALPKVKIAPIKKIMVTVWWSAAHLTHYSFLNPGEIITSEKYAQQIIEMQCLQPAMVNRKSPILLCDNTQPHISQSMLQKLKERAMMFCLICIFTWPLTKWLPFLQAFWQLFAGKMLPQPAGCRKCSPRVRKISKHGFLC